MSSPPSVHPGMGPLVLACLLALVLWPPSRVVAADFHDVYIWDRPARLHLSNGEVRKETPPGPPSKVVHPLDLKLGDRLTTMARSWAIVTNRGQGQLRMRDYSRLELVPFSPSSTNGPAVSTTKLSSTNGYALRQTEGQILYSSRGQGTHSVVILTPEAVVRTVGTEYVVEVDPQRRTTRILMLHGEVQVSNGAVTNTARSGEEATAIAGRGIRVQPLQASNVVQWWIYYPAVLDVEEIGPVRPELVPSIDAYRAGAIAEALAMFPAPVTFSSDAERIYYAALLLSAGAVDETEALLKNVSVDTPVVRALRTLIAAVQTPVDRFSRIPSSRAPEAADRREPRLGLPGVAADPELHRTASELMAESFAHQAVHDLGGALAAARAAAEAGESSRRQTGATGSAPFPSGARGEAPGYLETEANPRRDPPAEAGGFGFAWARVAELEFSRGHTRAAREAVQRALAIAPRFAPAHALRGFLLAADDCVREALEAFDQAIELNPALGNAWLGRGLCRRRLSLSVFSFVSVTSRGALAGGTNSSTSWLSDLHTAAILEPTRSLVRSYAGKAFAEVNDAIQARKELNLAKKLDPNDPTPWLYSALLNRDQNRINEAVRDLERSIELNDHRALYRSRLLLDEDRAVRGSSLARIYQEAGMSDVAVREAARAVAADYGDYSAHQFLAESYNALRDSRQINLRYETPWLSEYLLANLLAPVEAGTLSPMVTYQEYTRLFERNRLGLSSATEYRSQGDWWQSAVQHGRFDQSAYAIEMAYRSETGHRPNNDLEQLTTNVKFKHEISPVDSLFFQGSYYNAETGDVRPYYDEQAGPGAGGPSPSLRVLETQEPILFAGYHHQWGPGFDTLLLVGRIQDTFEFTNSHQPALRLAKVGTTGEVFRVEADFIRQGYRNDTVLYTAELQQTGRYGLHSWIAGARYQAGSFRTIHRPGDMGESFDDPDPSRIGSAIQNAETGFDRADAYAYWSWQPLDSITLIGGLRYDWMRYPENLRLAPVTTNEISTQQWSPRAGILWSPLASTMIRGAYARSLGGVGFDQSYQLEPSQIAGFTQAYRSITPEAVVGANSGAEFETFGLALDQKLANRTYLGVNLELLRSHLDRRVGVFENQIEIVHVPYVSSTTPQRLKYEERSLIASVRHLYGEEWTVGASYRVSEATLRSHFREFPAVSAPTDFVDIVPRERHQAVLHELRGLVAFNHRNGLFGATEAIWNMQSNKGYVPELSGDDFWRVNLWAGYRFSRRRAEVRIGLLNVADQNYRLNPLNLTADLPWERNFVTSLQFSF